MGSNRFRKDLLYRINAFIVAVPPLRDRKEDIPLLADYFITKLSKGGKRKTISSEAMKLLLEYEWPGNVRELANVVERAMLLSAARDEIVADDFPLSLRTGSTDRQSSPKSILQEDDFRLDTIVRSHIEKVLHYTGENKSKAARLLGISRKKFYQKLDGSS